MTMKLRLKKISKLSLMDMLNDEKNKKKGELEEKLETLKGLDLVLDNREVGLLLDKVMNYVSVIVFDYMKLSFSLPSKYNILAVEEITDNDIIVSQKKAHEFLQTIHSINMSNSLNKAYQDIAGKQASCLLIRIHIKYAVS